MRGKPWWTLLLWTAVILTVVYVWTVATDAVPWLRGPLPWPPEWQWTYLPLDGPLSGRNAVRLAVLVAYLGAAGWLMRAGGRRRVRLTLGLAVTFFIVWQLVQTWGRETSILDTLIFRTYAPPLNGFLIAPAQVASVPETLRHYVAAMPHFFGDKPQTHPPGLFILYALANDLFAGLPRASTAFAAVARTWAIPGRDWPGLADNLIASAFAASCLQVILTALAPLSLYALLRQLGVRARSPAPATEEISREVPPDLALWAALALPLISSFTLFFLQWDTVFPTLGFAAWCFALRGQNRQWRAGRCGPACARDWLLAGLLFSLMTWLSFGTAMFGALIVSHVLWRAAAAWMARRRAGGQAGGRAALWPVAGVASMAAGWAVPWVLAYLTWEMSFFSLARAGIGFHYALVTAQRSYRLWLWMNPVDFALWLGPALLLLGATGSLWLWRRATDAGHPAGGNDWFVDLAGMAGVFWLLLVYLDLSGTTRGEVGRLWMFLMPFPVIFALALPWRPRARLVILTLLAAGSWVIGYAIAGIIA